MTPRKPFLTEERAEAWIDVLIRYVAPVLLLASGLLVLVVSLRLDETSRLFIPVSVIVLASLALGCGRGAAARRERRR